MLWPHLYYAPNSVGVWDLGIYNSDIHGDGRRALFLGIILFFSSTTAPFELLSIMYYRP